jgi:hypothetical protein
VSSFFLFSFYVYIYKIALVYNIVPTDGGQLLQYVAVSSIPGHVNGHILRLGLCLWLYSPLLDLGCFFAFLILYTVGRTPWTGEQPVARLLPTHRTTQTQNKRTHTSMPRVGFEPTISMFEWAKMVHSLDRAATVIG